MTKKLSYHNVNKTPYLTWNWLKMNRGILETEIDTSVVPCAKIRGATEGLILYKDDGSGCAEIAELEEKLPFMAQSSSTDTTDIINSLNSVKFALTAQKKCKEPVILDFELKDGQTYSGRQIVIAEENSEITVIMNYTSLPFDGGFCAIQTKLWAKPYSKIHLVKVQLLGQKYTHLDDTQFFAEDNASIKVTQIELGSKQVFANVTCALSGYASNFTSETAYTAKNEQNFDINYCVSHTGKNTESKMRIKGTLLDNAKKLYRGTIDFKRGCEGSKGNEYEETLLTSPTAVNRSIPMILCGEENVEGAHGGNLGNLGNEELFYFQSRGIDEKAAKSIMTRAKIIEAASQIPDEKTVGQIKAFIGEEEN